MLGNDEVVSQKTRNLFHCISHSTFMAIINHSSDQGSATIPFSCRLNPSLLVEKRFFLMDAVVSKLVMVCGKKEYGCKGRREKMGTLSFHCARAFTLLCIGV